MRYLVLWTGGLDSTSLVLKLLQDGHHVTAAYIEIENNDTKTERELHAISEISKYLNMKFDNFNFLGTCQRTFQKKLN